jgi:hypothetical protein
MTRVPTRRQRRAPSPKAIGAGEAVGRSLDEEESARALCFALRRRGWQWHRRRQDDCLLPGRAAGHERFFALLRHYSFRLFLRDVIVHGAGFTIRDLVRYCAPPVARRYLRVLVDERLVEPCGRARYHLVAGGVRSFGATLEWFVARALSVEFGMPCAWNLRLEHRLDDAHEGGDYDVVALLDGGVLYVETKSSPPRNIEVRQATAFCQRLAALQPEVAVFLNDTQLHMRPKVVPLLHQAYLARFGSCRVRRLAAEVYLLGQRVYVINSDPDLIGNLGRCLAHHLRERAGQR